MKGLIFFLVLGFPMNSLAEEPNEDFFLTSNADNWYYKKSPEYQGWRYIVLHHSASRSGNVEQFDRYHRQQGFGGIAYHFVIGNGNGMEDGEVAETFRWTQQISGTHSSVNSWMYNVYGIGICLVGNFEEQGPTHRQLLALENLVLRLSRTYAIKQKSIVTHRTVPYDYDSNRYEQTLCPGKYFDVSHLRKRIAEHLN